YPASDENLSAIQFQYDAKTLEVVRILAVYSDKKAYDGEANYISNHYFWDEKEQIYFDTENFYKSKVNALAYVQGGAYMIHYGSTPYFLEYGHF
ncbi:MAG: hypothetical protein ACI4UN_04695, partial [Muribaculaceae bacterium]